MKPTLRRAPTHRVFPLVLLSVLLLMQTVGLRAEPWLGWRGTYRDGKSQDKGLLKAWPDGGPKLLWKFSGLGEGFSNVAVTKRSVYATGATRGQLSLFRLSIADGRVIWRQTHGPAWAKSYPGARATPSITGNRVYLLSGPGRIRCYDTTRGGPLWQRDVSEFGGRPGGWGFAESVLLVGNLAIVTPGGRKCVAALNNRTGRTLWTSAGNEGRAHYGSCIAMMFSGTPVVVNGTSAGLFGVDARNGRVLWTDSFAKGNTANCPTPAYSDGHVFWAVGYGKGGICLRLNKRGSKVTAQRAWTSRDIICHHGGYVIDRGYIYGNHQGGWVCLDLRTGRVAWRARGVGKGSICYADGMLYLFSENGGRAALIEANPRQYTQCGEVRVSGRGPSWAHPVVAEGRLFLRYADTLYCFDVRGR